MAATSEGTENIPEGLTELGLEELDDWGDFETFCSTETEADQGETFSLCNCGVPSTENVVECSRSEECSIRWFHQACIENLPKDGEMWICDACKQAVSTPMESGGSSSVDRQQKRAGGMKYPEKVFRKADATVLAHDFMTSSIEKVFTHELFQIKTPFCEEVHQLAIELKDGFVHENFKLFSEELVKNMWALVKTLRGVRWTEKKKSEMWGNFHDFRMKESNFERWNQLLEILSIKADEEVTNYMLQHIIKEVFTSLLSTLMETDMPPYNLQQHAMSLDNEEQQALRYCAGYVPFKLKKRYLKLKDNEVAKQYIGIIDSWVDDSPSAQDEPHDVTKAWIGMQNRGGLFQVNDEVYTFFKKLEMEVRETVNMQNIRNLQGVNIQNLLCNKLEGKNSITLAWFHLTPHLSSTCRLKLFTEVTHCFVKMRSEAFLKVYLDIRKGRDDGVSKKQEKGLRSSLKK
ncbi:hypothetical protein HOLleu_29763 [Holothuria leucospilota]|uniref:PHD-type domain-containing protein n=1 Tax=Holothuria leucospilota TaxID=206669 RepID=A0A9Q1BJE7_HOLLE|nr:hypothetical protein HOLleu_29763 [Holothuria leucospilota]